MQSNVNLINNLCILSLKYEYFVSIIPKFRSLRSAGMQLSYDFEIELNCMKLQLEIYIINTGVCVSVYHNTNVQILTSPPVLKLLEKHLS